MVMQCVAQYFIVEVVCCLEPVGMFWLVLLQCVAQH